MPVTIDKIMYVPGSAQHLHSCGGGRKVVMRRYVNADEDLSGEMVPLCIVNSEADAETVVSRLNLHGLIRGACFGIDANLLGD